MLVLQREKGQAIVIGHSIEITILEIRGNRVVLGVSAPRNIRVERGEKRSSEMEGTLVEKQEEVSMAADKEQDCNALTDCG